MWFLIGSVAILLLLVVAALVSDLRRREQLRRLDDEAPRATEIHNRGTYDAGHA